jgi:hypothetical protein
LLRNSTEPSFVVADVCCELRGFDAPEAGLTELQPVKIKINNAMGMIVFNIFRTYKDIGIK